MTDKLYIRRRGSESVASADLEADFGLESEGVVGDGALLPASDDLEIALRQNEYRVKRLRNTNILNIGRFAIDIEDAPAVV